MYLENLNVPAFHAEGRFTPPRDVLQVKNPMKKPASMAMFLASHFIAILREHTQGYFGGPVRPIIDGVTDKGTFVSGMTVDAFLARIGDILVGCGRIYRFGNSIVFEVPGDDARMTTIATQGRVEPNAAAIFANLVAIGVKGETSETQSLLPAKLVAATMADEALGHRLPRIRHYSRRPCFDRNFQLCVPGWNADSDILVHAKAVEPGCWAPSHAAGAPAIDRLPPHLKVLLGEFGWRSEADLVNCVAMLLTGQLINHFIDDPHPAVIVDGNTPGVGKTLLVQVLGRVLDGIEPPRIPLGKDEEVEKRLCAQVLSSPSGLFFFDNVRSQIESTVLEQNALSPAISFRVLGHSKTIERPNTFLFFITSNLTKGTSDFIQRAVPIRFLVEGDPKRRRFQSDPLAYAVENRQAIHEELAAMILRWVGQGRPPGHQSHRCRHWAATIGGILDACGLGDYFLANSAGAEEDMDREIQELATLAEHIVVREVAGLFVQSGQEVKSPGLPPAQWVKVAHDAQVLRDRVSEGNPRAKSTAVGIFLSGKLGRSVSIETPGGARTATLRRREGGANQKHYYFEVGDPGIAGLDPAPSSDSAPDEPGLGDDGPGPVETSEIAPAPQATTPTPNPAAALDWL